MPLELSPELKARIQGLAGRYPHRQAALLMVLHLVQDELGHLSIDAQAAVAHELDVPPTLVHEVTTFYEMYHEHPEGQFHLELCTNISCHLAGADPLMEHMKKSLGIEVGHQTEDGRFSLMDAECLASCGSGPVVKVGLDYYEYMTPSAVDALIERFKQEAPGLNGKHYICARSGPHTGPLKGFEPPRPLETQGVIDQLDELASQAEVPRPSGSAKPSDPSKPTDHGKSGDLPKAPEPTKSNDLPKAAEPSNSGDPPKSIDHAKSGDLPKSERTKSADLQKSESTKSSDLPTFEPPPLKRRSSGGEQPAIEKRDGEPTDGESPSGVKDV
jgi:NADH-quinone oxidoreductase subunit E